MKVLHKYLGAAALLITSLSVMAQPTPPDPVPIDGGLAALAAAGIGYGVRKYMKSKKD